MESKFNEHIHHSNDIANKLFSQINLINDNLQKIIWKNNNEIKKPKTSNENNEIVENISEYLNNNDKPLSINHNGNINSNSNKPNKNKKRGPYKNHNKNNLENSLKYLEIKD